MLSRALQRIRGARRRTLGSRRCDASHGHHRVRSRDSHTERSREPGPLPSPPERSAAERRRRSGRGKRAQRSEHALRGGHQSTGHEHDPDLGLINMKGRLYDPAIGRFISADPYVQYPLWSQSLNRYSYGFNNPMSGSDPTGYSWFSDILGGDNSSGWTSSTFFGGAVAIVGGAYVTMLYQQGAFAQGGSLKGFGANGGNSGIGGAVAVAEAINGLNDPGANVTYAAPTGELGGGATLYNENAGAAPPGSQGNLAANDEWCAGKWTEQGCSYDQYDVFGSLPVLPAFGDVARGLQAAWAWAFGAEPPLAWVLEGYGTGAGFTGVFDAVTGRVLLQASARGAAPGGWVVARAGGHRAVSQALGGNAANHHGFAAILQEGGTLQLTWRSGQLNAAPGNLVPQAMRQTIVDAVQKATGRVVSAF